MKIHVLFFVFGCLWAFLGVPTALRRGTRPDGSQGRGASCQLRPSLLHAGCQPRLPPPSWALHHRAVHLSARLLGQLHSEPGMQNTQVGSAFPDPGPARVTTKLLTVNSISCDLFIYCRKVVKSQERLGRAIQEVSLHVTAHWNSSINSVVKRWQHWLTTVFVCLCPIAVAAGLSHLFDAKLTAPLMSSSLPLPPGARWKSRFTRQPSPRDGVYVFVRARMYL